MLRCVRLKNFIHFEEEQVLHFKQGTCMFIGQNNSGKSSVFEAIRRCMSSSKNATLSSLHNKDNPGIAICVYAGKRIAEDKHDDGVQQGSAAQQDDSAKLGGVVKQDNAVEQDDAVKLVGAVIPDDAAKQDDVAKQDGAPKQDDVAKQDGAAQQDDAVKQGNVAELGNEAERREYFVSSYIVLPRPIHKRYTCIKLAYHRLQNKTDIGIDLVKDGEELINHELELSNKEKKVIYEQIKKLEEACSNSDIPGVFCIDRFLNTIENVCKENGRLKSTTHSLVLQNVSELLENLGSSLKDQFDEFKNSVNQLCIERETTVEEPRDVSDLLVNLGHACISLKGKALEIIGDFQAHAEKSNGGTDRTTCEKLLEDFVDKSTVITFALRSICPAQWTKSATLGPKKRRENSAEAQKKAEIITWYINELDKGQESEISVEERKEESNIFKKLTGRYHTSDQKSSFDFKKNNSVIVATYGGKSDANDVREVDLLKVPEGYYEAKKCSIMLAIDMFKTVCLEDPDRGMHPQMVMRLRDLVLPTITNKVVIIISHNPCFISATTMLNTVFFQREENKTLRFRTKPGNQITVELNNTEKRIKDSKKVRVASSPDSDTPMSQEKQPERNQISTQFAQGGKEGGKDHRIIASPHFAILYFAKRVMFVEGEGDFLFMEEMRSAIMKDEEYCKSVFKKILGVADIEKMRQYLCLMQFIPMSGHTHKARLNSVCTAIKLERSFLLDYDALIEDESDKEGFVRRFIAEFDLPEPQYSIEKIIDNIAILERAGIFVWKKLEGEKKGAIEQAIIELDSDPGGELRKFLLDHHVELKFPIPTQAGVGRGKGGKDKKFKLFVHPELTATDISQCVTKILTLASEKGGGEINRLVKFVYKLCTGG